MIRSKKHCKQVTMIGSYPIKYNSGILKLRHSYHSFINAYVHHVCLYETRDYSFSVTLRKTITSLPQTYSKGFTLAPHLDNPPVIN